MLEDAEVKRQLRHPRLCRDLFSKALTLESRHQAVLSRTAMLQNSMEAYRVSLQALQEGPLLYRLPKWREVFSPACLSQVGP